MTTARRHPLHLSVLALVWVILQQRFSLSDVAIGYLVGTFVLHFSRWFLIDRLRIGRPYVALRLALRFAREIVQANVQIAWVVVQPRLHLRPAFIVLPLRLRDDVSITLLANMITLTPGTLAVDVAADQSALYIHCLTTTDPVAVRQQIQTQFEQRIAESLECLRSP